MKDCHAQDHSKRLDWERWPCMVWITYSAFNGPNACRIAFLPTLTQPEIPTAGAHRATLLLLPVLGGALPAHHRGVAVSARVVPLFRAGDRGESARAAGGDTGHAGLDQGGAGLLVCGAAMVDDSGGSQRPGAHLPPLLVPGFLVVVFATAGWHVVALFQAARDGRKFFGWLRDLSQDKRIPGWPDAGYLKRQTERGQSRLRRCA